MVLTVTGTIAGIVALYHRGSFDPRLTQALALARHGDDERALELTRSYLAEHPDDSDAHVIAFLARWGCLRSP